MSAIDGVESLYLLPDRFEVAEFSAIPNACEIILGESADREISKDNFNWMGAYLVEEVGLHEMEVAEWFQSKAKSLRNRMPLDVWRELDGFEKVFEYAKDYKAMVDEVLVDEPSDLGDHLVRSHSIANSALEVILKGFEVAGVDIDRDEDTGGDILISNPNKPKAPIVSLRKSKSFDQWRIILNDGDRRSMYNIGRHLWSDQKPEILLTAIYESTKGNLHESVSDSDIDGRPPSAGEVAKFVIPLANEIKNRSLKAVTS